MWDLAGSLRSRQAPPGTESVPEKLAGIRTLGWADDFRVNSLPSCCAGSSSRMRVLVVATPAYFPISKLEIITYNKVPTDSPLSRAKAVM